MNIRDRARADWKRFSQSAFDLDVVIQTPPGVTPVQTATVKGIATRITVPIETDGQDALATLAHVAINESALRDANADYPIRDSNGLVALNNHLVTYADANDTLRNYAIKQVYPDDTVGMIMCHCADSKILIAPPAPTAPVFSSITTNSFTMTVTPPVSGTFTGYQWEINLGNGFEVAGTTVPAQAFFNFSDINQGQNYEVRVLALSRVNSAYLAATQGTLLATPINPTITGITHNSISFQFESQSQNIETGFGVEISTDDLDYTLDQTLAQGVTSGTISGLDQDSTYFVRFNALGTNNSDYTTPVQGQTILLAPSGLQITSIDDNSLSFSFQSNSGGFETGFDVELSTDSIDFTLDQTLNSGITSGTITGLDQNTRYYIQVNALGNNDSGYTSIVDDYTTLLAANTPTVSGIGTNALTVNWASNSGGFENGFRVETSTDNADFNDAGTVGPNVLTFGITGLTQGVQYFIRIVTIGEQLEVVSGVLTQYTRLASTTTPSATPSTTSMQLNWANPSGGAAQFVRITYRQTSGGSFISVNASGTSTSHTITGLTPNTSYQFFTQRIGFPGQNSSSNSSTVTRSTSTLSPPTITEWENDKSPAANVNLNYNAVSGASEYYIWFRTNNGSWQFALQRSSTSELSIDPRSFGAISGQSLAFRVGAGASGNNQNNPGSAYTISSNITYT